MKKSILIIALLSMLLVSADSLNKVRLTFVNKSKMDMAIQLKGEDEEELYYLSIPAGDVKNPTTRSFTVVPDTYAMQPYYIETWDPVYGFQCEDPEPSILIATRQLKLVFKECGIAPPNRGERTMMKYWTWRRPFFH